jgi:hypothetical protein
MAAAPALRSMLRAALLPVPLRALALAAGVLVASGPVWAERGHPSGSSTGAARRASAPKQDVAEKFWAHPAWNHKGTRFVRAALGKLARQADFDPPVLAPQWDQAVSTAHGATLLRRVVDEVRERARKAPPGEKPYVVLDIDDTVLDGRPRIAEAARIAGLPDPTTSTTDFQALFGKVKRTGVWGRLNRIKLRVFSEQYHHSEPGRILGDAMPGAVELIAAIEEAGGEVLFHTARSPYMRQETLTLLERIGMPIRDPDRNLVMGGSKHSTARRYVRERGEPVAAIDNEPHHAVEFRTAFRTAFVARLASTAFRSAEEPPPPRLWILSSLKLSP